MRKDHAIWPFQFIIFSLCLFLSCNLNATVSKHLWEKWQVHNPLSTEVISHQRWQSFLDRHVTTNGEGINLIDYPSFTQQDHEQLQQYLTEMSQINIRAYNRQEQLAYWLNLYNALTIQLIADYYPVDSIQEINISPGLFSIGPWKTNVITVNKTRLTLDDILNRILRPIWNDPRIHYALNNASIGAANIPKKAFQGVHVDKQLNEVAFEYVHSMRAIQVIEGKLVLSQLYDWYKEDFGENERDIICHLYPFATPSIRAKLKETQTIYSYMYNWHLNTTPSHA